MNLRISSVLGAALAAAFAVIVPASGPDSAPAARHNNLGCAYMNQQLFEKGLKEFQAAIQADPKFAMAKLNEGVAYSNLQKVDQAKAALEAALKLDPKSPNAWYGLGLLAKNAGDAEASIGAFKRVTEIDPNDADTWYFLGTAYVQAKEFPQAIDAFQHALKINPIHASAEFGLSRAYQQSGNVDDARAHLKKFQYITQNKIGAPMSLAYGEQGQYSRAVESPQQQLKPLPQIKVQFLDVTKQAGMISRVSPESSLPDPSGYHGGACFLDYDNDGKMDLFLTDNGPKGGLALYHNLGNGKFEDMTQPAGFDPGLRAEGCTAGDYDNDGFADLAFTTNGRVKLFHNNKNGTFSDVTEASGIKSAQYSYSLTFVDYDHDGDLDLYALGREAIAPVAPGSGVAGGSVSAANQMWRNNGNGTFSDQTGQTGLAGITSGMAAIGTDYNNDRAVDLLITGKTQLYKNPREGKFLPQALLGSFDAGAAVLDFDHDGWMDVALSRGQSPALTLWRNVRGTSFEQVAQLETNWVRAFGIAAFDYDNDGWVDLVAVGETKDGRGEIRLFRNLGPDGFKDVTADVGLDKIPLEQPRAIITGDYDNDGSTDLLITQNHGPALLLRNQGATQNHWLKLSLKGLADNKSAIGTKVEVFSGGNRQKFEIYGSNGYFGQSSTDMIVGLGDATEADIVRMLWPTGVLQDEIQVAGDKRQEYTEVDRRGSSCPTLFAWNGERYEFVADMLGAGVVGHWVGPGQRDIPRPVEWIRIPTGMVQERGQTSYRVGQGTTTSQPTGAVPDGRGRSATDRQEPAMVLSFRFMEPLEEAVYLDQVRLLAVDHPAGVDVYPNEYFASNPPYPEFKVVVSRGAKPPAGAWDDDGHDVLPELLAHRYFGDFPLTGFLGFAQPHSLTLDLGAPYEGGPLWLLMHGEVEYFSANSMYAASQAGIEAIPPYVEAEDKSGTWKRVIDDMGFPAGGPRTMTADLTGKLPRGTQKIRITTNLQIYWNGILVDRTGQQPYACPTRSCGEAERGIRLSNLPLIRADLEFHGYPYKIEGTPPGNVNYIYEKASATGPYTRPTGTYTRYGDVLPLLTATDDRLAVFGSGDEVRLDFDPAHLPALPRGWGRDYFFAANGYEKDMDFYAAEGNFVAPLPFLSMGEYPYEPKKTFPLDNEHVKYLLEYNTRHMSGNEQRGYGFDYGEHQP
jgi:cytochrome c-type biogenesis protein CcmH/NrfG